VNIKNKPLIQSTKKDIFLIHGEDFEHCTNNLKSPHKISDIIDDTSFMIGTNNSELFHNSNYVSEIDFGTDNSNLNYGSKYGASKYSVNTEDYNSQQYDSIRKYDPRQKEFDSNNMKF